MSKQKTYSNMLKDQRWLNKRTEILERDRYECQWCKHYHKVSTEEDEYIYDYDVAGPFPVVLEIHHIRYESFVPWETSNKYLITVCQLCHEELQSLMRSGRQEHYLKLVGLL